MHDERRRAFTLLELIFTIGIVLVLAAIVFAALRGVRESANRADTGNALRQLVLSYNAYLEDNKQALMPGACQASTVDSLGILPDDPHGHPVPDSLDAGPYVWRIMPYLNNDWESLCIDYRRPQLVGRVAQEISNDVLGGGTAGDWDGDGEPDLAMARIPSFGLNATFLGGNDLYGNNTLTNLNPWSNPAQKIAATRFSEVKNPAQLLAFAPTAAADQTLYLGSGVTDVQFGSPEIRPPFLAWDANRDPVAATLQWDFDVDGNLAPDMAKFPNGGGVPIARWGDFIPVGHLDGSIGKEELTTLGADLRKWSPFETGY